jgi:2-hydroxychromene-2-carboxylate isomerase
MAREVDFYFDFLSPFCYFALKRVEPLPANTTMTFIPVLFAGLLKHWNHKGPAELPPKRRFTMRHVQWIARKHGIPFAMPPAHPFNPLAALRLSIALHNDPRVVHQIFDFIWREGHRPDEPQSWHELTERLNVSDADSRIAATAVKEQLRRNGEQAVSCDVFGVPTFIVDNELFWGYDAVDFLVDYLRDPTLLQTVEMRRASELPIGIARHP